MEYLGEGFSIQSDNINNSLIKLISDNIGLFSGSTVIDKVEEFVIEDITMLLPVNSRKKYGKRDLSKVKQCVLHHAAGDISPEMVALYHTAPVIIKNGVNIGGRDWPGIAYHFYIYKDKIYLVNDLKTVSYHVANNNTSCIGICVNGNYETSYVEDEELLIRKILFIMDYCNKQCAKILDLLPHRHFKSTLCPGKNMPVEKIINCYKLSNKIK